MLRESLRGVAMAFAPFEHREKQNDRKEVEEKLHVWLAPLLGIEFQ
jgi:hypothetical protein